MDIISGPFYYLGPSFTVRRIFRTDRVYNPATEYAPDMVNFTYDYTGDGWPDILASGWDRKLGTRPIDLYVNPKGEPRRWDHTTVLPTPNSETVADGGRRRRRQARDGLRHGQRLRLGQAGPGEPDGGVEGLQRRRRPDRRATSTGSAASATSTATAARTSSTIGGWYEQPAGGATVTPVGVPSGELRYGEHRDGRVRRQRRRADGRRLEPERARMGPGVVRAEEERRRAFEQHEIATDYSTKNAGNVVFSEAHAARFADMNGDKIPDFIVGKRYWSHLETYNGPDPYGPAVDLHLPDGAKSEGARRRGVRARARPQPVGRRLGVRGGGHQQGRQAGHRSGDRLRDAGVSE